MNKVTVYKDQNGGAWSWVCRVPFCGRQDWVLGNHAMCVAAARGHLAGHTRTGFTTASAGTRSRSSTGSPV